MFIPLRFFLQVSLLLLSVILCPLFAKTLTAQSPTAETPSEFVQKVINEMKSRKSASAVADFIHWPSAYKSLTPAQIQTMGVKSPKEFEAYVRNLLASPSKAMKGMMEKRLEALGPDAKAQAKKAVDGMVAEVAQQEKDLVGKIERAQYTIGKVTETEGSAQVELTTVIDGNTSVDTIQVMKIDGKWYLPTVNAMGSTTGAAPQAPANPVGAQAPAK